MHEVILAIFSAALIFGSFASRQKNKTGLASKRKKKRFSIFKNKFYFVLSKVIPLTSK
jgi:hypothetical protein